MNDSQLGSPQPNLTNEALHEQRGWFLVALASIGDAVITTDTDGRVTFLNSLAEALTGWTQDEATGVSLKSVFKIVNQESRQPVESPTVRPCETACSAG